MSTSRAAAPTLLAPRRNRGTVAIGVLGQSNEHGAVAVSDRAAYPQTWASQRRPGLRVPIGPALTRSGGYWLKVHDDLYDGGYTPTIVNGAINGLSFLTQACGQILIWTANYSNLRRRLPTNTADRGYAGDLIATAGGQVWRCVAGNDLYAMNAGPLRDGEYGGAIGQAYWDTVGALRGVRDPVLGYQNYKTGATEPSWPASPTIGQTLTETPVSGSDVGVTWRYEGQVGSNGYATGGTICTYAHAGIGWDPLGVVWRLHEEMQRRDADRKIIYIANGQTDLGMSTSAYKSVLKNLATFYLWWGYEVMIGFTNYSPGSSGTLTNWNSLSAGRTAAVSELKATGIDGAGLYANRVFDGADLYTLMGTTGPMASGGGFLQADNIHLNGRGAVGPSLSGVQSAGQHIVDSFKTVLASPPAL